MPAHLSAKRILKRSIQHTAARLGRHTRKSGKPELLILMYHRILPTDNPRAHLEEPGMLVTPASFGSHLEHLSNYFEFVLLSDWLDRRRQGQPLPSKACAITFDDGWADNFEYAFPILQNKQVPATIFLVAQMMGTDDIFWPEKLGQLTALIAQNTPEHWKDPVLNWLTQAPTDYVFDTQPPTNEQISQMVAFAKQHSDDEINHYISQAALELGIQLPRNSAELLDWDQINEMGRSGLIEFGSHTCHHIRLNAGIAPPTLEHEIIVSKKLIQDRTGQPVSTFCFPNGDISDQALALVKQNYLGAVTTASGWNTLATDDYLLQRIGVHEDISADRTGFLARVSGWI